MTSTIYTLEEIKRMIEEVLLNTEIDKAILFGSYAKSKPTELSDIDILLDSNGKVKGLKYYAIIDMIQEKFKKDVDIIEKSEIDKNSKIEKEIERTGIVIYEK